MKNVLCSKPISILPGLKVLVLSNTFPLFDTESSKYYSKCGRSVSNFVTSFIHSLAGTAAFRLGKKSRAFGSKTTSFGALKREHVNSIGYKCCIARSKVVF